MHVLAITPELPRPGEPGSMAPAARQIQSLREAGVDFTVLDLRGIPIIKYLLALPKIRALLGQVDLVHAHFGYCGWLGRLQHRTPVVISFMGDDLLGTPDDNGRLKWFSRQMVAANKQLAARVNQVIVKSPEMARVLAPTPCHIVPNGVDLDLFQPVPRNEARRLLGWPQDDTCVLFPGNPDNPRKGHALAQAATRQAEQRLGHAVQLKQLWQVPPDQVPLYMNACDAMWMTSLIEGSPNVVKEALACNRPIVAVPVGDVADLLRHVEGCRVAQRDPLELGRAMAGVLTEYRKSSGRVELQRRGLDLPSVAERIIRIYELALHQKSHIGRRLSVRQAEPPSGKPAYQPSTSPVAATNVQASGKGG